MRGGVMVGGAVAVAERKVEARLKASAVAGRRLPVTAGRTPEPGYPGDRTNGGTPRRALSIPEGEWGLLASVFEGSRQAMAMLDASMRVVVWNGAASEMTWRAPSAVLGCPCEIDEWAVTVNLAATTATTAKSEARATPGPGLALRAFRIKDRRGVVAESGVLVVVIPVASGGGGFLLFRREAADPPPSAPANLRPWPASGPGSSRAPGREPAPDRRLTRRQRQILALLASGKTAKPIASELSLSVPTVRTHIQHILRKLGVHSCLEAVVSFLHWRAVVDRRCHGASANPGIAETASGDRAS